MSSLDHVTEAQYKQLAIAPKVSGIISLFVSGSSRGAGLKFLHFVEGPHGHCQLTLFSAWSSNACQYLNLGINRAYSGCSVE
mmetsp:Transcript_11551/g.25278  ORF Transcript_11551/g.25278 Transcript_11551/m.25278 type:complete len:82 (+) Transcript_11551:266-511(+)